MIEDRGWGSKLFDVLNYAGLLALALLCVIPLVHLWALSLSDRAAATGGLVSFWPVRFTTVSYKKVLEAGAFISAAFVSVKRTVLGTALQMLLLILMGFALSKNEKEFPGRDIIMSLVLFAYLFNGGLIPWFLVIRKLGILDTIWALIIPPALPMWSVILMMNFFRFS